jgi:hypothetical protein
MSIREGSPCGCGSQQPRHALYDGNGIFCAYVCSQCEAKVRARYRPEIMNRSYNHNDVDEDIWGED